MRPLTTCLLVALLSINVTISTQTLSDLSDIPQVEKYYYLSMIWKEIDYNYPFFDMPEDFNWDKIYKEHLELVKETGNLYEFYRVLQRFTASVQDCNTRIVLPPVISSEISYPLIEIQDIEGKIVITNIGKNYNEDIPLGSIIIEIDHQPVERYFSEEVTPYIPASSGLVLRHRTLLLAFTGERGTRIPIKVQTPQGNIVESELIRSWENDSWSEFVWHKDLVVHDWLDEDIVHLEINHLHDVKIKEMLSYVLKDIKDCKGIVLDLRSSNYGNTYIAYDVVQHFTTAEKLPYVTIKSRKHIPYYYALGKGSPWYGQLPAEPYLDYGRKDAWMEEDLNEFDTDPDADRIIVPMVILTSEKTTTPAEDMVMVLDNSRNDIKIAGSNTQGRRGQALTLGLPYGGQLWINTTKDVTPTGKTLSKKGIQPDVNVRRSYDDYLNHIDTVLQKGHQLVKEMIAGSSD